jgi:hypothetical protein
MEDGEQGHGQAEKVMELLVDLLESESLQVRTKSGSFSIFFSKPSDLSLHQTLPLDPHLR